MSKLKDKEKKEKKEKKELKMDKEKLNKETTKKEKKLSTKKQEKKQIEKTINKVNSFSQVQTTKQESTFRSIKKYLIWFIIWLSFLAWVSYASTGTIWWLFEKISWQWKLVWTNIKDWTVWTNQLWTNSVTTTKILDKNVTEAKLADDIVVKLNTPTETDPTAVKLTWNQSIWWIKTFTSPVVWVTPTANNHLATKQYVDTAISTALASIPSYTYSWDTWTWWSCSVSCGWWTQTRSVTCRRNDGVTVADSFCTTTKPATSQTCNTGACPFVCWWTVSAWWFTYTTKLWPDWKCWTSTNMKHIPSSWNSWCYDNNISNCNAYGRLYDWYAATHSSVCPALGTWWALPTDDQWTALINYWATWWTWNKLSGIIWSLPGYRSTSGGFYVLGSYGGWWSSTEDSTNHASFHNLKMWYSLVYSYFDFKDYGFSVVCIKN